MCAAMDSPGRWIVTGGEDGVARVWQTPESVALLPTMSRANWGIRALAFSPDGSTILTGNDDGELMLWDAQRSNRTRRPHPEQSPGSVLSVAFRADGRMFAAAGERQPVRIFDSLTGRLIRELPGTADSTSVAFRSRDGALLVGGEQGKARLWVPSRRPLPGFRAGARSRDSLRRNQPRRPSCRHGRNRSSSTDLGPPTAPSRWVCWNTRTRFSIWSSRRRAMHFLPVARTDEPDYGTPRMGAT